MDFSSETRGGGGRGEDEQQEDSCLGQSRKMIRNKRRFSEEQIKSLESRFEEETKLEPQKKAQLARDLGLHPRQVAIWFQNRRARWKSKQLEREYNALRADYDALASRFQSLKEEKRCLLDQVQNLGDLLEKNSRDGCSGSNCDDGRQGSENRCLEQNQHQQEAILRQGGRNARSTHTLEFKEDLQRVAETEVDSFALPDWSALDSYVSDHSCSGFQWWDLWH